MVQTAAFGGMRGGFSALAAKAHGARRRARGGIVARCTEGTVRAIRVVLGEALRLSTVCVWAIGAVFVAGLAPALFAQAELAEPGLQVVAPDEAASYNDAVSLHGLAFAGMLPLCCIALALAVIAEAKPSRIWQMASVAALLAAPVFTLGMAMNAFGEFATPFLAPPAFYGAVDGVLLPQAIAGLIVLVCVAVLVPRVRRAVVVLAIGSAMAVVLAVNHSLVLLRAASDGVLHDTYFVMAADHMAGVAVMLNILGGLAAWSIRWEGASRFWFGITAGAAVLFVACAVDAVATQLGLMGMPRRYMDYPEAFAGLQMALALLSFALVAVLIAVVVWLAIIMRFAKRPPGVETTFE